MIELIYSQERDKYSKIALILADLLEQSKNEIAVFLITKKPVKEGLFFEMERIHNLPLNELILEIEAMLNRKSYEEVLELYKLTMEE